MKNPNKKTHGGKREGAGRPVTTDSKKRITTSVQLLPKTLVHIVKHKEDHGSIGRYFEYLIEMEKELIRNNT